MKEMRELIDAADISYLQKQLQQFNEKRNASLPRA